MIIDMLPETPGGARLFTVWAGSPDEVRRTADKLWGQEDVIDVRYGPPVKWAHGWKTTGWYQRAKIGENVRGYVLPGGWAVVFAEARTYAISSDPIQEEVPLETRSRKLLYDELNRGK
jgi:hypothetical protein